MNALLVDDRPTINLCLRQHKTQQGAVNFKSVLSVPREQRIEFLAQQDFKQVAMIITATLTVAFESMNLKRGMNANQILDLTEAIIDGSSEDKIALEDLALFLQKLVRGEYGAMYESMDIPKFMDTFEIYREERHQQLHKIRYEQEQNLKSMGAGQRNTINNELDEHFHNLVTKVSSMKDELRTLKHYERESKKGK